MLSVKPSKETAGWLLGFTVALGVLLAISWRWIVLMLILTAAVTVWVLNQPIT